MPPRLGVAHQQPRIQEAVPSRLHPTSGAPASAHAWIPPADGSTGHRDVQPHVCGPCTQGEASYTLYKPYNHRPTICDRRKVENRHLQHTLEFVIEGVRQFSASSHISPFRHDQCKRPLQTPAGQLRLIASRSYAHGPCLEPAK